MFERRLRGFPAATHSAPRYTVLPKEEFLPPERFETVCWRDTMAARACWGPERTPIWARSGRFYVCQCLGLIERRMPCSRAELRVSAVPFQGWA